MTSPSYCGCKSTKDTRAVPKKIINADDIDIDSLQEVVDPRCDPEHPVVVTFDDVKKATAAIRDGIVQTPFRKSFHLSKMLGMEIYLKFDFNQITGSFKDRGARWAILNLSEEQKKAGVITASAGNHAQAISYHGTALGVPITVVMPITSPIMKIQKCKGFGANVIVKGKHFGESKKLALNLSKIHNMCYVNGYDDPDVVAGQGSVGLEICEELPDVDAILVPTGGGGLLAGVAVAVNGLCPKAKVIAVEPERAASFKNALDKGKPVDTPLLPSLADGLSVPCTGFNVFATAKTLVYKAISLKEPCIAIAILRLLEAEKCVVEGSGSTGLAAILGGHMEEFKGKKVAMILSGGNIDTSVLGRVLDRGLAADGRLVKMKATVRDRAGGVSEFLSDISELGVSIKDVMHERAWVTLDVYSVLVTCILETRDYDHSVSVRDALQEKYKTLEFIDFPTAIPGTVPCE